MNINYVIVLFSHLQVCYDKRCVDITILSLTTKPCMDGCFNDGVSTFPCWDKVTFQYSTLYLRMVLSKSFIKMRRMRKKRKRMRIRMRKMKTICNYLSIRAGIYCLKALFFRYATMLVTVTAQMDLDAHVVINLALEEVSILGWAVKIKARQ